MNEIIQNNIDFSSIYNKSHRLAAAIFLISDVIDKNEELRTKIKNLSLELVSLAVSLKNINFLDAKRVITILEKNSLELMSLLDIASVANLVSKMNGNILKEEFQSFILELNKFSEKFDNKKDLSFKGLFVESLNSHLNDNLIKRKKVDHENIDLNKSDQNNLIEISGTNDSRKNNNGHRRKDLRKNTILEFIKGHYNASIKDIVPNIVGCSEKTIQRELVSLINEGKIRKIGERRWSKYSIA